MEMPKGSTGPSVPYYPIPVTTSGKALLKRDLQLLDPFPPRVGFAEQSDGDLYHTGNHMGNVAVLGEAEAPWRRDEDHAHHHIERDMQFHADKVNGAHLVPREQAVEEDAQTQNEWDQGLWCADIPRGDQRNDDEHSGHGVVRQAMEGRWNEPHGEWVLNWPNRYAE